MSPKTLPRLFAGGNEAHSYNDQKLYCRAIQHEVKVSNILNWVLSAKTVRCHQFQLSWSKI